MEKNTRKGKFGGILITVVVSLTFLMTLLATLFFEYSETRRRALDRVENVLLGSAKERANTLTETLNGQYAVLDVLSDVFSNSGSIDPETVVPLLARAESNTKFLHIVLDMPDGTAYLSDGTTTNVSDRLYFMQSLAGERSIEYVPDPLLVKTRLVIMSIPINHGSEVIGVLHGSYELDNLTDMLIPQTYADQGSTFICDDDARVIISSDKVSSLDSDSEFIYGDMETLIDDLTFARPGKVTYKGENAYRYAVYAPLGITTSDDRRWFIVNEVPLEIVESEVADTTSTSVITILLTAVAAVLTIMFYLWRETINKRRLDGELEQLAMRERQYRIVAKQSGKNIYRYDINTRKSVLDQGNDAYFGESRTIENTPDTVLKLCAEESQDECREFFRKIHLGNPTVSMVALMRNSGGDWRWIRSDATVIFSASSNPAQAIVSYYDVTEQREKELLYRKWQRDISSIPKNEAKVFECNLTYNTADKVEGELFNLPDASTYTQIADALTKAAFAADRVKLLTMTNRERLIGAFCDGVYQHSLDYRIGNHSGRRWVNMTVQLARYPDSNDIKAFFVIRDIDRQKREEISQRASIELDVMTGALNRASFIDRVNSVISDRNSTPFALIILDVDNLKHINDSLGHQTGDQTLITLVSDLRKTVRESDIIGRIGGDEFMILLKGVSRESIEDRAESICRCIRRDLSKDVSLSISMGVSFYPSDAINFTGLYEKSDKALYKAKNSGRNKFVVYEG